MAEIGEPNGPRNITEGDQKRGTVTVAPLCVERGNVPKVFVPYLKTHAMNEDEREFWDTVDVTEYLELFDFQRVVFPHLKRTNKLVSLRLDSELIP
jgi:hypothetical protein